MKKINKIVIRHIPDYDADLSYIGTFDRTAESDLAIEHEPGDTRTFNWFNPQPGTCETLEDSRQEYERMIAYDRGNWGMLGIRAEAETAVDIGGGNWKIDTLTSGGLWGVESDSGKAHIKEIEDDQLDELKTFLLEYGFTQKDIDGAEVVREA